MKQALWFAFWVAAFPLVLIAPAYLFMFFSFFFQGCDTQLLERAQPDGSVWAIDAELHSCSALSADQYVIARDTKTGRSIEVSPRFGRVTVTGPHEVTVWTGGNNAEQLWLAAGDVLVKFKSLDALPGG